MSPDDILASNLWLWPDPILKRSAQGQVIFVNAAFLNLYGGQAQNWHGQIVNGWPGPVQQGAQRFETRAGQAPQESVFDWVEMSMADGSALAIARNVTALLAVPTPAPITQGDLENLEPRLPTEDAALIPNAPPLDDLATRAPSLEQQPAAQARSKTPVETHIEAPRLDDTYEDTLSHTADDYSYTDMREAQNATPKPATATTPQDTPASSDTKMSTIQNHDLDLERLPTPDSESNFEQISDQTQRQTPVDTEQHALREEQRMVERRALPIKDSEAILGSNWRDQVIAKAIGVSAEDMGSNASHGAEPQDNGEPEQSDDNAYPDGTAAAGVNILLAEDNAINALLTRTLLEAEGAIVETVEDGALAVDAVRKKAYDLVFMDMRMPVMDGLEATRKIRALGGKNTRMPIIALTANAFDDDRNACFDSGMNDYMTKPVSAEELVEMVTTWIKPEASQESEEKLAS
jgi:CheY-like chemotaxis protein